MSVAILLILSIQSVAAIYKPYDCRRLGSACVPIANLCNNDGLCACPILNAGPDCSVLKSWLSPNTGICNRQCVNGGQCFRIGNTLSEFCLCPPEYYGPLCEYKRVDVIECSADRMTININPFGQFQGQVYPLNIATTQSSCQFRRTTEFPYVNDTRYARYDGWIITYDLTQPGCGLTQMTLSGGDGKIFQSEIITDYGGDYITEYSIERHTLSCIHAGNGKTFAVISDDVRSDLLNNPKLTGADETKLYGTVDINVLNFEDLSPIAGPVQIGDKLSMQIRLVNTAVYTDFRVDSCKFVDTRDTVNRTQKHYIENSCFYATAYDIKLDPVLVKNNTDKTVYINFGAFRFKTTNVLFVECDITYCRPGQEANCAAPVCSDGTLGYGRKRRAATNEDGDASDHLISRPLLVLDSEEYKLFKEHASDNLCDWRFTFILTTTVLASVMFIILGLFISCMLRKNRPSKH